MRLVEVVVALVVKDVLLPHCRAAAAGALGRGGCCAGGQGRSALLVTTAHAAHDVLLLLRLSLRLPRLVARPIEID